jgi:isoleucyl-tRNA synthetase
MRQVLDVLIRLLAPVLVFTAEETWTHLGKARSVHLERFPEFDRNRVDASALREINALLAARSIVSQSIETARQQKLIGNALEAYVELWLPQNDPIHQIPLPVVAEFLILSDIQLRVADDEPHAVVTRTEHERCDRCWRHLATVGTDPDHPGLCDRCARVVSDLAVER